MSMPEDSAGEVIVRYDLTTGYIVASATGTPTFSMSPNTAVKLAAGITAATAQAAQLLLEQRTTGQWERTRDVIDPTAGPL